MADQEPSKTLADYFEATKVKVSGAPDLMERRRARMKALIIDGRCLSEYELGANRDRESAKRFVELQWLAIALVGCNIDLEVSDIRSLAPPAADFEATLKEGGVVRIELSRLVDEDEKRYLSVIGRIAERTQMNLDSTGEANAVTGGGAFVLRFYNASPPASSDIEAAASELADFIRSDRRLRRCSTTLWPAGADFPTLYKLGAHVVHLNVEGLLNLTVDPSPTMANQRATAAAFLPIYEQKKGKIAEYSGGHPVWLALCVDTRLFYPIGVIHQLSEVDTFDPRPFSRVLVGCPTAGVIFEAPNQRPRYVDLSGS